MVKGKLKFGLNVVQSGAHPSFHNVIQNIPHHGPVFKFSGFMDDFGFLVPVNFQALAIFCR